MKAIRVLICAGAFSSALFSGSFAAADAVDDLLAGKPVVITPAAPGVVPAPAQERILERLLEPQTRDEDSLSQESIEVNLTEPSQAGLEITDASSKAVLVTAASGTNMNLVPEPSAIALAVGSLVYFLIFFRRRYSF